MKALSILVLSALILAASGAYSAAAEKHPYWQYHLGQRAWGPVRIGMTIAQAAKVLDLPLPTPENKDCGYIMLPRFSGRQTLGFMVTQNKISRIDVYHPQTQTYKGAHIGMTEAQVRKIYPRIKIEPHKYDPDGHYMIYEINTPTYKPYRIVFETDGKQVVEMRSGYDEEAGYVEGCS